MLFSSTVFLFLFLPIVLVVYFVAKEKYRNYILLIASLFFYAWGEPRFVIIMIGSILVNYAMAVLIDWLKVHGKPRKWALVLTVLANMSVFFIFKYLDFSISIINTMARQEVLPFLQIVLPIGISFFTFQALSYVIDVYRGDVKVQKNPFFVGLYIALFPQLIAGPIVRYSTIEEQIMHRSVTLDGFCEGARRFIVGLAKKIILANTFAIFAEKIFLATDAPEISVMTAWLGSILYGFQIFFDFSGYSDMAIGLGRMFGFRFLENFNYPFISGSSTEFWKRWHISMGSWFRDYVYFPMGGSRVKTMSRMVFNLFVVWFLTGLWHGASWNFIIWGLMFFVLVTFEKLSGLPGKLKTAGARFGYRMFFLTCLTLSWVIVRFVNVGDAGLYYQKMFGAAGNSFIGPEFAVYWNEIWVLLLIGALISFPIFQMIEHRAKAGSLKLERAYSAVQIPVMIGLFVICVSYLVVGSYNPFIYFNF